MLLLREDAVELSLINFLVCNDELDVLLFELVSGFMMVGEWETFDEESKDATD